MFWPRQHWTADPQLVEKVYFAQDTLTIEEHQVHENNIVKISSLDIKVVSHIKNCTANFSVIKFQTAPQSAKDR